MKALLFDCETTGLVENHTVQLDLQPSIIEFYGCIVNLSTGEVEEELDLLIKPPQPVSGVITKITGLTNEDLKDAPPFAEVGASIFQLIEKAPLVIAHNASFDQEMLDLEAERMNYELKWPRVQCSVEATISMKGFRLSLSALHQELFGEPFSGAHRAKTDVAALTRICVELVKRGVL